MSNIFEDLVTWKCETIGVFILNFVKVLFANDFILVIIVTVKTLQKAN